MLNTTIELIEYLKLNQSERELAIVGSLVNSIIKCGTKNDAEAVLTQYLTNPSDFHYSSLLPIFKKLGDNSIAEQIFNVSIFKNELRENADPKVLAVLGHLKYSPIKPILAGYIFSEKETNYYVSKYAVLGLLNFDCSEYQSEIETEIEKCYGKGLFPEFVPALVCKLKNRNLILDKLYESGNDFASTDCNAGIVLGFSLSEEQGRPYFKRVLFDRNWETSSTGTGTIHFAYQGLKNLGITFKELYQEIRSISDERDLKYYLDVFFALLKKRVDDMEINKKECISDIYITLFKWKNENESDNIIDLASSVDMEEVYEIEKLIELKMNEEIILRNYTS